MEPKRCDYCTYWPWADPGQCCKAGQIALERDRLRAEVERLSAPRCDCKCEPCHLGLELRAGFPGEDA